MSNAIVVPDTFKGPVSAVFQGQQSADDLSAGITGGYGLIKYRGKVWSIQHNGNTVNLMRDDGDGPRGSIDIIIVKANPQLSKTWYEFGWDENSNNPPDCASANGIYPDAGVPKKQNDICATCVRNAWGSAPGGGKGKACGDHRRLAVVPLADPKNEYFGGPLLLRCPAASLQDMAAFEQRYRGMGYPYYTMAIKVGFDPQESYPKFVFQAIRPLSDAEAQIIVEWRDSPLTSRVVNESTGVAAPVQVAQQAQPTFLEAPPPNAVQPQQVSPQPGLVTATPPPVAAVQQPAAAPSPVAPAGGFGPVSGAVPQPVAPAAPAPAAGGFGPAAATGPAPTPQPAAQAQPRPAAPAPAPAAPAPAQAPPARQMTGFGGVTPEVTAPVAQAAPAAPPPGPAPVEHPPGVVADFEGSIDARLNALLNQ